MYFPIADVTVSPVLLMSVGFLVGILGGFFGVGGGFLAGPMMFWTGVPMNFVVGTDLAHMTGKSLVAARRHRALGHVDLKLGLYMVLGTVVGVEIGARIIEALEETGAIELTVGITYIVILVSISAFTAWESIRAIQMVRTDQIDVNEAVGFQGLSKRIRAVNIPPIVSFPVSGIECISLWMVLGVGFITGILAGSLGVGGGFIRMPMLIYVLGIPTQKLVWKIISIPTNNTERVISIYILMHMILFFHFDYKITCFIKGL